MGTCTRKIGLLMMACCLALAGTAWAAPSTAELAPPTVAVENAAGDAGEALVEPVTQTLVARAQAMPGVRASVAQPWALQAQIASAAANDRTAQVRVIAELTPPTGNMRYVAEAVGEAATASEAAGVAAGRAMEDLGVCLNSKGTLYYYNDDKLEAYITIGSSKGLRPQARIAFVRDGVMVAEGTVITVKDADSIARVDADVPAGTVLLGDDARVVSNGPRAAVRAVLAHERRQSSTASFLALIILGGLIAL